MADTLIGGSADDFLLGGLGNDVIFGAAGNDVLYGNAGDDVIHGGVGNDLIGTSQPLGFASRPTDYEIGADIYYGGGGDDTFVVSHDVAISVYGEAGNDLFIIDKGHQLAGGSINGGEGLDSVLALGDMILPSLTFIDVEMLDVSGVVIGTIEQFSSFQVLPHVLFLTGDGGNLDLSARTVPNDIFVNASEIVGSVEIIGSSRNERFDSAQGSSILRGGGGQDTLSGYFGDDRLFGQVGRDSIIGGAGNDTLAGGSGDDTMAGGTGDDLYGVDSRADVVTERADEGIDTVRASVSWALGDNVENLVLTGKKGLFGDGNALDNDLTGNRAKNVLSGKEGDDTLNGRMGADVLWGGLGDDRFVFDTTLNGRNVDAIRDFGRGDDTIVLGATVFTALEVGALDASALDIGNGIARTAETRILYNSSTGALSYDADGSGSGAAVQFALLKPNLALTADDFVVV